MMKLILNHQGLINTVIIDLPLFSYLSRFLKKVIG